VDERWPAAQRATEARLMRNDDALDALAGREDELYRALGPGGSAEERLARACELGLGDAWQAVVDGYVALLDDPHLGAEALKRALFLVWYAWAEPGFLTGMIAELAAESVDRTLARLDRAVRDEAVDEELRRMLAWYGRIEPLPFEQQPGHAQTLGLLRLVAAAAPVPPERAPEDWARAGSMGRYWAAVTRPV
jgi:hypothetical protein